MALIDAYIGLGSNLDNPIRQVKTALEALGHLDSSEFQSASPLYRSAPVGPAGQPDYINAVAHIRTKLSPLSLLDELQAIEQSHQRVRSVHWGPRTLDLDILLYGQNSVNSERLTIPHTHMLDRNFVLIPLFDINPDLVLPDGTKLSKIIAKIDKEGLDPL